MVHHPYIGSMSGEPQSDLDKNQLRSQIAKANGIALYQRYSDSEAADFLGLHPQTLKSKRLAGNIEFVRLSPRNISYLGYHIVDFIIGNIQWRTKEIPSTASETTGSDGKILSPQVGIDAGLFVV